PSPTDPRRHQRHDPRSHRVETIELGVASRFVNEDAEVRTPFPLVRALDTRWDAHNLELGIHVVMDRLPHAGLVPCETVDAEMWSPDFGLRGISPAVVLLLLSEIVLPKDSRRWPLEITALEVVADVRDEPRLLVADGVEVTPAVDPVQQVPR